jgi:hypothetical protein
MEQLRPFKPKSLLALDESFGAGCKLARTFSDFVIDGLWADAPAEVRHERSERLLRLKDRRLAESEEYSEVVNDALEWEELS